MTGRRQIKTFLLAAFFLALFAAPAFADAVCAICGQPIRGTFYFVTDKVTGEQKMICPTCIQLPRCFICGLPVKEGGVQLPDGRRLCPRDARTAVLDAGAAQNVFDEASDELDRLFSRFTTFPTNVDIAVIDRVDVDSLFNIVGNTFESPDLLGVTQPMMVNGRRRYKISLLIGIPKEQLKETCAHELSHAWVNENVSPERHAGIARDTEEGFCEMVGYLLMESQGKDTEEKRVLANHYTRGQVQLFLAAERQYGFDDILDWMKYGRTSRLEEGHLDEIRDVKIPAAHPLTENSAGWKSAPAMTNLAAAPAIRLQGIVWGKPPAAIINGQPVFPNDRFKLKIGGAEKFFRCLEIQTNFVRVENVDSGERQELHLWSN